MRKITILFLFLTSFGIHAQDFGFKAGGALSIHNNTAVEGVELRPGFYAGVLMEIYLSHKFTLQPELLFTQISSPKGNNQWASQRMNFVSLPVALNYVVTDEFNFNIGLQADYILASSVGNTSGTGNDELFTIGGLVGASYHFQNGFAIDIRYVRGFSNIGVVRTSDVVNQNVWDSNTYQSNIVQLGVAYHF